MVFHQPTNSIGNQSYNAMFYDRSVWEPHFHKNFELVYVCKGSLICTADEKSCTLYENEFALFLSNEIHSLTPMDDTKYWVGVFSGDFVHSFAKLTKNKSADSLKFTCEKSVLEFLKINLINYKTPPVFILKSCLYAVCNEYLNQITLSKKDNKNFLQMQAIIDYVAENYKNKISLSDIAKKLGYNYHYLSKKFNKIFSMSFSDFLNLYRLETAIELLNETDLTVTEIAIESGFQSIRSFNELFKKHTGTTPVKYRLNLK